MTTLAQPSLFDAEQRTQLKRVHGDIARVIIQFLKERLTMRLPEFKAEELRRYVARALPTAPASADRILRNLRATGQISYVVVNRRASVYRLLSVS